MNRYPSTAADDSCLYKTVPTTDTASELAPVKSRKRNTKPQNVAETSFTSPLKPNFKQHRGNGNKHEKCCENCLNNTKQYFCEFCDNTSIHGFKFLGERQRFVVEKIWWMLVISLAVFGSVSLIEKTYKKWVTSPVIVTFATTETPIWEIPFPAVTICPEVKVNKSVLNYTDVYLKHEAGLNITNEEREYFSLFRLVCDYPPVIDNGTEIQNKNISTETLQKFIEAHGKLNAKNCKWLGEDQHCEEILTETVTSEGSCLTFNVLDYNDMYGSSREDNESATGNKITQMWSLDSGYTDTNAINTSYPRRTMLSGIKGGFQVDLYVEDDDLDYLCRSLQGFKVTLHHPAEEPNMDKHFRVPLNQAVTVGIKPKMIKTSEEIRAYPSEIRQCYLPNEKILQMFEIYSQQSCMFECLINYTMEMCRCCPFYVTCAGETTCGAGSKQCMEEAKVHFLENEVALKINKVAGEVNDNCGCLPACTSLEFDSETSQCDWNWRKSIRTLTSEPELSFVWDMFHVSRLIVYYKETQFLTSERHELYGLVDFLANCGGLLGLFCGFSFTSLMEIIYFLTLRLVCNLKKFGRRVWSGLSEQV